MVCEYSEMLGVIPLEQTQVQSSVVGSQVSDVVVADPDGTTEAQIIGHCSFWVTHHCLRVARATESGLMD